MDSADTRRQAILGGTLGFVHNINPSDDFHSLDSDSFIHKLGTHTSPMRTERMS